MKNMNESENAMERGPQARRYPMLELFPFAGKIKLSEAALQRLDMKPGDRIETGCFNDQLFLRKATGAAGYLLRPVPGEDAGRVEFTSQFLLKAGKGAHSNYDLKVTDMPGWFEVVAVTNEMEARNG